MEIKTSCVAMEPDETDFNTELWSESCQESAQIKNAKAPVSIVHECI